MRVLDLDLDYFLKKAPEGVHESEKKRLSEEEYGSSVWPEHEVRVFFERNLGLSQKERRKGRIVSHHNESLYYWKKLIHEQKLSTPFEVVHIDSHADLGVCYSSYVHIMQKLLGFSVEERPFRCQYKNYANELKKESIGDYLLFAVAYRWVSKIVYCGNPSHESNDYYNYILKGFKDNWSKDRIVENTIQLLHNPKMKIPRDSDNNYKKLKYIHNSRKEPEVPFTIIQTIEDVHFNGDFDYAVLAQSPNYTPASADYIMDVFREYIVEE